MVTTSRKGGSTPIWSLIKHHQDKWERSPIHIKSIYALMFFWFLFLSFSHWWQHRSGLFYLISERDPLRCPGSWVHCPLCLCRFIVDTAKIGLEFDQDAEGFIKQSEIERVVAQMMDGEEGKSARRNMLELQQLARRAIADGGSSRANFEKSLNDICPMPTSSTTASCKCTKPTVQTPHI